MYYVYLSYETKKEFNRCYIGYRKCPEGLMPYEDQYMGSYTDKTFEPDSKIVIQVFLNAEEAKKFETFLQFKYDVVKNIFFANKSIHTGDFFFIKGHSKETKEKISKTKKSQNLRGDKSYMKGRSIPQDVRAKISSTLKGRPLSDECKKKISSKLKGRKLSQAQVETLRSFKHTEECKKRMSLAKMGDKNPMKCTKHSFINPTINLYEENICIKDLINKYEDLKTSGVQRLVNGKQDKYKNWEMAISSQDGQGK